ncbi:thioredoxin family protein [Dinoroseobacter sp. PD6]|uniref:thioredoxin family protein n=1 Tax=Dinoroseobacter sp. PD6 TaxID=3028384 RepID=UPI00237C4663|nr:thioredoxin family protein [Dinoroseobacter sp. PD6]MDD9717015.1 thioredoxin family protein [Dinoroseobacter sp. PD6]
MPRFLLPLISLALILTGGPMRAQSLELVMVEQVGCSYCAAWHREIGPAYPKTDEGRAAPLRVMQLRDMPGELDLAQRARFTPTFLLISEGREIARLEGYPGADFFWPILAKMIEDASPATQNEAPGSGRGEDQ